MILRTLQAACLGALILLGGIAAAQPARNQPAVEPFPDPATLQPFLNDDGSIRTGRFTIRLAERSPWTTPQQLLQHLRNAIPTTDPYTLEDETIHLYIPPGYDGSEPYGLLVYINPGGRGEAPEQWLSVLEEKKLIWVGPDNIGNNRAPVHRIAISLDCAWNLPHKHYHIHPDRIYVSGFSGGGRISSWVALNYPEAVNGMIAQGGIDYWMNLPVPDQPNTMWPQKFQRPAPGPNFVKMLRQNRHAMIIGTEDPNYQQTVVTAEMMTRQRLSHVLLIEMPGKPHVPGGPEELTQAIDFLDAPISAEEAGEENSPQRAQRAAEGEER